MRKYQGIGLITKQMDNLKDLSTSILQTIIHEIMITCSYHTLMSERKIFR